jgi:hypothetical protein
LAMMDTSYYHATYRAKSRVDEEVNGQQWYIFRALHWFLCISIISLRSKTRQTTEIGCSEFLSTID